MADDDFTLDGEPSSVEASLDDFFQPADLPEDKAKAQAEPIEGDVFAPPPAAVAEEAGAPPPVGAEPTAAEESPGKEPRKFFSPKILLVVVIVLGVGVLGAGAYFAYTMFLADMLSFGGKGETEEPVNVARKGLPNVPGGSSPAAFSQEASEQEVEKKVEEVKGKPGEAKPEASAKPKKSVEGKGASSKASNKEPTKPDEKPAQAPPDKKPTPIKTASISTGPYTIQVGSYMMKESMKGPEEDLGRLGYTDYHYVDTEQTLTVYDVFVGGTSTRSEAEKIMSSLEAIGYKPTLKKVGADSYKVLAYSYGSKSVANKAKAKIEKAGAGKVEVKRERRPVTLHQLRVGHFPSSKSANSAMRDLKKAGFDTILVKE